MSEAERGKRTTCAAAYDENAANAGNADAAEEWAKAANCVRRIAAICRDGRDTPETRAMVHQLEATANGCAIAARKLDGGKETMKWKRKADGGVCGKIVHTITGVIVTERSPRGRPRLQHATPHDRETAARFCEIVEHAAKHDELTITGAAAELATARGDTLLGNYEMLKSWAQRHGLQTSALVELCRDNPAEWEREKATLTN